MSYNRDQAIFQAILALLGAVGAIKLARWSKRRERDGSIWWQRWF